MTRDHSLVPWASVLRSMVLRVTAGSPRRRSPWPTRSSVDLEVERPVGYLDRVRAHVDQDRRAERLAAGVVEAPAVLGALDRAPHDQAVAQQGLLVRAVAVGGVEGAVGRAVEGVVVPLVTEGDDVLGFDVVGLAGFDPAGHRGSPVSPRSGGLSVRLLLGQAGAGAGSGRPRPSLSGAGW